MKMNSILELKPRHVVVFGVALVALTLVGCNRRDDSKTAGEKVDSVTAEVKKDAEQAKESAGKAVTDVKQATGAAAQTAVTAVEDTAITAGIKAKLATDPDLKTLDISVETTKGHAILRGTAPNAAAQSRAEQLAAGVSGVTSVDNQLTVLR